MAPGRDWRTPQRLRRPCRTQVSDEHVMTALHAMQDHLQQTTVIFQRCSQKSLSEQSTTKQQRVVVLRTRPGRPSPKRVKDKKRRGVTASRSTRRPQWPRQSSTAPKRTPDALEKHAKTVTMRAESLATTEADFFKTLLDRQEQAHKRLNELSAQISHQHTTVRPTQ